jgi:hypothetical protein
MKQSVRANLVTGAGILPISLAILLLSACVSPTPYQAIGASKTSGGYSDQQIEDNRYRVMFVGNSYTSRQRVENFLLFRAAQLTLEKGFDSFTMVTRQTEPHTHTSVTSDPFIGAGYWAPSWRFNRGGFGWGSWDPWLGSPFWANDIDVQTVTSYEASAEILVFHGMRMQDPNSFDARQVVAHLGSTVEMPR